MNYEDVFEREDKHLSRILGRYLGYRLLLLSQYESSSLRVSLGASPIARKIHIGETSTAISNRSPGHRFFLRADYTQLPLASESMNVVLLPHTLELTRSGKIARLVLAESWRVLAPNGHLILLGTNPLSLRGLYYLIVSREGAVKKSCFHTMHTICRWIHYLGGDICHMESFLFRPPLRSRPGQWLFDRLFWLEKISPWLFPYLGGIYLLVAQKRVKCPNDLGWSWHFSTSLTNKALAPNVREAHYG